MNTRPTKTCHTNTTHPPKPDNPPNEHGPNGLPPNQTFQTTHPLKRVFSLCEDPPDEDIVYHTPASAGTFYRATPNPTNAQIRPRAKHRTTQPPIPPDPRLPATYTRTKQIQCHTPTLAGISTAQYPTRQMHRPGPKQNMGPHRPPYP
ncbi:hypothetical protein BS47DRAFT_1367452 [Hydnum rufescens UP504]|uniref:Uncharacterized protein n=1 Tax=Hydnum rufescens UP504 TaxID=1448309 RepID=A0A9P6DLZ0_9AGAM|nr:hypothetical protein BS47DRAFT_1367452 [Hydnum rufescens UP504]